MRGLIAFLVAALAATLLTPSGVSAQSGNPDPGDVVTGSSGLEGDGVSQVLRRQQVDDGDTVGISPVNDLRDLSEQEWPAGDKASSSSTDGQAVSEFLRLTAAWQSGNTVAGFVRDADLQPPSKRVRLSLFEVAADGSKGQRLEQLDTNNRGNVSFASVPDGCYIVEGKTPTVSLFGNGDRFQRVTVCTPGNSILSVSSSEGESSVGGTASDATGRVSNVAVDLYAAESTVRRGAFLASTSTNGQGRFDFTGLALGCYLIVFGAPGDYVFANGSKSKEKHHCVTTTGSPLAVLSVSTNLAGVDFAGSVLNEQGAGKRIQLDLFRAVDPWTRGGYVSTQYSANGQFNFESLEPDCYIVVAIAPDWATFDTGSRWHEVHACTTAIQGIDGNGATTFVFGAGSEGISRKDLVQISVGALAELRFLVGTEVVHTVNVSDVGELISEPSEAAVAQSLAVEAQAIARDTLLGYYQGPPQLGGEADMVWEPRFGVNFLGYADRPGNRGAIQIFQHRITRDQGFGPHRYTYFLDADRISVLSDGSMYFNGASEGRGHARLKYSVVDASGRPLEVQTNVLSTRTEISVIDTTAVYPLTGTVVFTNGNTPDFAPLPSSLVGATDPRLPDEREEDREAESIGLLAAIQLLPATERLALANVALAGAPSVDSIRQAWAILLEILGLGLRFSRLASLGLLIMTAVVIYELAQWSTGQELEDVEAEINKSVDWITEGLEDDARHWPSSVTPESVGRTNLKRMAESCMILWLLSANPNSPTQLPTDSFGQSPCSTLPIMFPTTTDLRNTTLLRADALQINPQWLVQRRYVAGHPRGWYTNKGWPDASGAILPSDPLMVDFQPFDAVDGCLVSARPLDRGTITWECDEYPNASMRAGGGSANPRPAIRWMTADENFDEGQFLNRFYNFRCNIADNEPFAQIPIIASERYELPLPPSFMICGS